MKFRILAAASALALSAGMAHADGNLGRNLAATCANCHGTNGKSVGGNEALAGVPAAKIMQKLKEFRTGEKPATIMHQIAKGYTEEQLQLIAAYFAAQK